MSGSSAPVEKTPTTCPVPHPTPSEISSTCSVPHQAPTTSTDDPLECPVSPEARKAFLPGDDHRNHMPAIPNQTTAPGQTAPLSTSREASTIPTTADSPVPSSDSVWMYPSEQMFFNAMRRKNWSPREQDMGVVVPIHNAVNERCWREILRWEDAPSTPCGGPKLVKFEGRPKDLTIKARIYSLLGYTAPFDRHDWIIDRCGTPVRYIIDFYAGNPPPGAPPGLPAFFLDVRPALTPGGIMARAKRLWQDYF